MYRALIICNSRFPGSHGALSDLNGPKKDGFLLRDVLTDHTTGMFDKSEVRNLNEGESSEVASAVEEFFGAAEPDDTLLFYYSGHGHTRNQQLFLCTQDTDVDKLYSTAIPSRMLNDIVATSLAQVKILILDCSYSAMFRGSEIVDEFSGTGRYVIATTSATERASDGQLRGLPSPFTEALADALHSRAEDRDGDGLVDLDDVYSYLDTVSFASARPHRTFDGSGAVPIARRPIRQPGDNARRDSQSDSPLPERLPAGEDAAVYAPEAAQPDLRVGFQRFAAGQPPQLLAGAAADTVPEPGDGRVRAVDRLGIANEVEMLVSVLLAKDTPLPLALGLFGDWGSGKSFFMAMMHERVSELADLVARAPEDSCFCSRVRQVRFNAWHYIDANLWASLATTLFDELADADAPDRAQDVLIDLDQARVGVREARSRREDLERQVQDLEARGRRPAAAVAVSVSTAMSAVRDKPLIASLQQAAEQAGTDDADVTRLINTLGEVESTAQAAGNAWQVFKEELLHRRRWVSLAALVLLAGAAVAVSVLVGLPAGTRALAVIGSLALGLAPALTGASRVLYLVREARQARELPLVRSQEELAQARADEERAEQRVARREQELADLRDQGLQLRQFVRERAASSDYRGKLGIISQVRRDFEQLVALIPSGQDRAGQAAVHAALAQVPEVDRIVLYIDDLDRCPHEQVVEVLQAVHLLLAFRLFVVVVGVDSRWLRRSLLAHYDTLLEEPDSYLEKIFQIPFTLRPMTATTYRDLVGELAPSARAAGQAEEGIPDRPTETGSGGADRAPADGDEGGTSARAAPAGPAAGISELAGPVSPPSPEALVITDPEREMLGRFGAIVRTPRAAKRLVNIYRMLRVSVPRDEERAFLPDSEGGGEYQAVIVLLSILVGRSEQAHEVFTELMAADADSDAWPVLAKVDGLADCLSKDSGLRETKVRPYRRWAPRVSRFSFRLTDVLPHAEPSA